MKIEKELEKLIFEDTAGNPMGVLKWSRKSTHTISEELCDRKISISPNTVGKLLKEAGYSLKVNRKAKAETKHPDRNQQFEIISDNKKRFSVQLQPIISVDSKKTELIGNFKNLGRTYRKKADVVLNHDFRSVAIGIGNPYGIYDCIANNGTVVV